MQCPLPSTKTTANALHTIESTFLSQSVRIMLAFIFCCYWLIVLLSLWQFCNRRRRRRCVLLPLIWGHRRQVHFEPTIWLMAFLASNKVLSMRWLWWHTLPLAQIRENTVLDLSQNTVRRSGRELPSSGRLPHTSHKERHPQAQTFILTLHPVSSYGVHTLGYQHKHCSPCSPSLVLV